MITPLNSLAADTLLDIPECFRPVAQAHGRALYEFVMNVQLAGEAAERLTTRAEFDPDARFALTMLLNAANANANAYAAKAGWGEAELVACKQAIEVAFATSQATSRIVLDS